ncbi:MAG: hypothetical protein IBX72_14055 [Nitrospirae bacterium]|nr:hypothetical protein [Nitrospirota bacterium]
MDRYGMIRNETTWEKALRYRCPACYYLVEKDILFDMCCPICGWVSPLVKSRQKNANEGISQVDLIDEGDNIRITAELPVLDEKNIMLDVNGNKLLISSGEFAGTIQLRCPVEHIIEKTYSNGVLDVQLKKMERWVS